MCIRDRTGTVDLVEELLTRKDAVIDQLKSRRADDDHRADSPDNPFQETATRYVS